MTRGEKGFAMGCLFTALTLGALGTNQIIDGNHEVKKNSHDTSAMPTRTLATVNEVASGTKIVLGIGLDILAVFPVLGALIAVLPGDRTPTLNGHSVV